ncbi:MAG: hypothetical protein ABJO29_05145 [Yoonia sp.]|uniref:hypothetical protein n=1 Tax=Rhodobacterales TaxID=204455 RepID=UPI001FF4A1A8|nr:hypothetical protein [Loktanella sp. F6476L]MCK0120215.1 hypothetical protein [Loktanella sp. F6476L]UWQ99003.1 hypothetical protein K3729_16580 [Rhodobacteraceae bacterium S2214]
MAFHFKSLVAAGIVAGGLAGCADVSSGGGGSQAVILANKVVTVSNNTGRTIWRFYGSPTTTNSWEEDILGSEVFPAGTSRNIDFADGRTSCGYDMRAEFQDGTSIVKNNIDVCTVSLVSFP